MKNIRKKMENKGFTLVEIIVCLAIMTIVAGSVGAFIVAGNNSYLRGNKELTLQEEAQLAANQMIDLIIDVEKDIKFTNTTKPAVDMMVIRRRMMPAMRCRHRSENSSWLTMIMHI